MRSRFFRLLFAVLAPALAAIALAWAHPLTRRPPQGVARDEAAASHVAPASSVDVAPLGYQGHPVDRASPDLDRGAAALPTWIGIAASALLAALTGGMGAVLLAPRLRRRISG